MIDDSDLDKPPSEEELLRGLRTRFLSRKRDRHGEFRSILTKATGPTEIASAVFKYSIEAGEAGFALDVLDPITNPREAGVQLESIAARLGAVALGFDRHETHDPRTSSVFWSIRAEDAQGVLEKATGARESAKKELETWMDQTADHLESKDIANISRILEAEHEIPTLPGITGEWVGLQSWPGGRELAARYVFWSQMLWKMGRRPAPKFDFLMKVNGVYSPAHTAWLDPNRLLTFLHEAHEETFGAIAESALKSEFEANYSDFRERFRCVAHRLWILADYRGNPHAGFEDEPTLISLLDQAAIPRSWSLDRSYPAKALVITRDETARLAEVTRTAVARITEPASQTKLRPRTVRARDRRREFGKTDYDEIEWLSRVFELALNTESSRMAIGICDVETSHALHFPSPEQDRRFRMFHPK